MIKQGITRREREVTDPAQILDILNRSKIVHIAMVDGDEPYMVPMNYGSTMEDGKLTLYLHGAKKGRKLDVMRANPKVFFSMECDVQPFPGAVACKYGTAYSCVMGAGIAHILEEPAEKQIALTRFMKTQTGLDFDFDEKMASIVSAIRIDAEYYTAKCRPFPE
jgi:nitroimidazol reductase NimA-like FMN-containing flavoprotein (pyridoxamine 5'-phosphate oxidase superfamily)